MASMDHRDRFALRKACDQIVGIRQYAGAVDVESGGRSEAFQLNLESGYRGVPVLPGQDPPALGSDLHEISAQELRQAEEDFGWIEQPGQPMMFWQRRSPAVYVVITPAPEAL